MQKYAKHVFSDTDLVVFWAHNEVIEAMVENRQDSDQRCLFIIEVGSKANGPLHGHPRHLNPVFPENPSLASLPLFFTVCSSRPSDGCSTYIVPVP